MFKNKKNLMSLYLEYYALINYKSNYDIERKKQLLSLNIEKLSRLEIEELKKYNEDEIYSKVFTRYFNHETNSIRSDQLLIEDYIKFNDLDDIAKRKFTQKELKLCDEQVKKLSLLSEEQIKEYINRYNIDIINSDDINVFDLYICYKLRKKILENKNKNKFKIFCINKKKSFA